MSPTVVSAKFAWSDYPGLRPGRLYAGKPDLFKRPQGEAHFVDGPDATETLCGQSRTLFPHEFADVDAVDSAKHATMCADCQTIGAS